MSELAIGWGEGSWAEEAQHCPEGRRTTQGDDGPGQRCWEGAPQCLGHWSLAPVQSHRVVRRLGQGQAGVTGTCPIGLTLLL